MGKSAPKAPDPWETAQAQGQMNRDTAITQFGLNAYTQNNPWGSVDWQQTGTWDDGTPKFTQTTTLSPEQQATFKASQQAERNLADTAQQQSGFLQDYLGQTVDTSGLPQLQAGFGDGYNTSFDGDLGLQGSYAGADDFSADRQRYEDALWQRMAGDRSQQENQLRTTLANKGIREGSAAWNAEMARMGAQNTDARLATLLAGGVEQQRMVDMARQAAQFGNEASLAQGQFGMGAQQAQNTALINQQQANNQARQQGFAETMALRNQPINEITALLSGSQVSNPAQMSAPGPQTGVAGVDYTGLVNQKYQADVQAHQARMGGLFGLGSALIGALPFSDKRLKTDIRRVGQTDGGTPVYTYRYKGDDVTHMGVMAQEVPEARVMDPSGYYRVDYSRVN